MSSIPYELVPPNPMFNETGPRILVAEEDMTDENWDELEALMKDTGAEAIRVIPKEDGLSEGDIVTADGFVLTGWDQAGSSPGWPVMPTMKRKRRK